MTNIVQFPEDVSDAAYWRARRFSPRDFGSFCDRNGIDVPPDQFEAVRDIANRVLTRMEQLRGPDAALHLMTVGDEKLAAILPDLLPKRVAS